jgi:hypothetical protein
LILLSRQRRQQKRLVGVVAAISVVVVAREACCGGGGPVQMYTTINLFWTAYMFAGDNVRKGEFIVVSYRLMLHDFSNNLLITKGECLSVVAVVAATAAC